MKRTWVRLGIAAGVVVLGLYAIALAQRGSVSTSEASPPANRTRPHFVRPDMPNMSAVAPATTDAGKNVLQMRTPQMLPSNPAASAMTSESAEQVPANSNSRYVTQQDVRDYRLEQQRYADRYEDYRRETGIAQKVNYDANSATEPTILPATGALPVSNGSPALMPPAAPTAFASDSAPSATTLPQLDTVAPVMNTPTLSIASKPATTTAAASHSVPATAAPSGSAGAGKPGPKTLDGPQTPSLVVEKVAPVEIQIGKPAKFSVTVRNVGTAVAQDVEIHDEVPAGTQLVNTSPRANRGPKGELIWTVGAIKPNDEITVQMDLLPTTEGEIGSVAHVRFASSASSRTICTRPELVVEVTAAKEVLIGEELNVQIRVSNPGTGAASGVVLTEIVPAGFEHPAGAELEYEIGELRPNESRDVELSLKAIKAGAVVNRLTVRDEGPLNVTKETPVTVVAPALEIALEGTRRRFLDRQAVYTVALSNPGTAPAREVSLVAHLPPGLEFVEANNAGQYDARTRTVNWLLEELPAREMGKVTLTTLPTEQGDLPLKISSTAQRGLSAEKQEVVKVEGLAALVFQVVDQSDPIDVNGETTYEIRVANQGSKAAENVQIVAMLPPELKPVSAEGPARYEVIGQQVIFQPLARLAAKSETVYAIRAQAVRAGDVKISVQLKSAELPSPVVKEEATRILSDQ